MPSAPATTHTDLAVPTAARACSVAALGPAVPGMSGNGAPKRLGVDRERGLVYEWLDRSPERQHEGPREAGYETAILRVLHEPTERWVGWLSISYTTADLVAALFPGRLGPLMWAEENTGVAFGFDEAAASSGFPDGQIEEADLWAQAHRALSRTPASMGPALGFMELLNLAPQDAPADPVARARELDECIAIYREQMDRFTAVNSTPFVAYAHVDGSYEAERAQRAGEVHPGALRGTGVGRRMYELAAQELALSDRVLMASFTQTPAAMALWGRLRDDPTVPTKPMRVRTGWRTSDERIRDAWVLDYRSSQSTASPNL